MRKVITATEGHILTNGEIYGTEIYLAEGADGADFYEITLDEYNAMLEADASSPDWEVPITPSVPSDEATVEDYQNALKEMGVQI